MAQTFSKATGTQTASVNTEHILDTEADAGVYVLTVNLENMVAGDTLELRAYAKCLTGDSQTFLAYQADYSHLQGDDADAGSSAVGEVLAISVPIVSAFEMEFTLKQTAGTGRDFPWRIDQLS